MKFWDTSAIIPLCLKEPQTRRVKTITDTDPTIVVWWATPMECQSAFARLRREGNLTRQDEDEARTVLAALESSWVELVPSERIREHAGRALLSHPLRAADSLQLGAALAWSDSQPRGFDFICLDRKLSEAAQLEGFTVRP